MHYPAQAITLKDGRAAILRSPDPERDAADLVQYLYDTAADTPFVLRTPEEVSMTVKGRDLKTGLPRDVMVSSAELLEVLRRPARIIVEEVLSVLELTSPELVGDIAQNGIILTGGGSLIWGMDRIIQERTEIPCMVADDPESCVALGCGKSLNWINSMQEGTINIARKKLMRE